MAEDLNKKNEELQEEQLDEVDGGTGGLTMASKLFKKLFE